MATGCIDIPFRTAEVRFFEEWRRPKYQTQWQAPVRCEAKSTEPLKFCHLYPANPLNSSIRVLSSGPTSVKPMLAGTRCILQQCRARNKFQDPTKCLAQSLDTWAIVSYFCVGGCFLVFPKDEERLLANSKTPNVSRVDCYMA